MPSLRSAEPTESTRLYNASYEVHSYGPWPPSGSGLRLPSDGRGPKRCTDERKASYTVETPSSSSSQTSSCSLSGERTTCQGGCSSAAAEESDLRRNRASASPPQKSEALDRRSDCG
eukprot:2789663-Pleurochrysis_carterae.AAC.1